MYWCWYRVEWSAVKKRYICGKWEKVETVSLSATAVLCSSSQHVSHSLHSRLHHNVTETLAHKKERWMKEGREGSRGGGGGGDWGTMRKERKQVKRTCWGGWGGGEGEGAEGVCSSKTRIHPLPQTDDLLQFSNKVHSFFCSVRKRQRHLDRSGLTEAAHGSPAAHGKSLVAIWNNRW